MFHRELYKKAEEKKMQTKKNADKKKMQTKKNTDERFIQQREKKKQREKTKKETPFPSFSGECLTHQKKNSSSKIKLNLKKLFVCMDKNKFFTEQKKLMEDEPNFSGKLKHHRHLQETNTNTKWTAKLFLYSI